MEYLTPLLLAVWLAYEGKDTFTRVMGGLVLIGLGLLTMVDLALEMFL